MTIIDLTRIRRHQFLSDLGLFIVLNLYPQVLMLFFKFMLYSTHLTPYPAMFISLYLFSLSSFFCLGPHVGFFLGHSYSHSSGFNHHYMYRSLFCQDRSVLSPSFFLILDTYMYDPNSPGTDSAIKGIENSRQSRLKKWVKPASPEDTARAIVQAAAAEQDELYYPWHDVRPMVLLYSAWPGIVDGVLRFLALRD